MDIYWASVFMLPSRFLLDIEQVMQGFLWCQGEIKKGKAKVAWEVACLPKDEGGLGIRRLELFNSALMVSQVWKLLSLKESLWVKSIHAYKLNGRSFWDVPIRGDGANKSLWYDHCCENYPLSNHITTRDMFRTGLNLSSMVKDIVQDGAWVWPPDLLAKYPFLSSCSIVMVEGSLDKLEWRANCVSKTFLISQVWANIRQRGDKVAWYNIV
nr:hypothetical protein [Tanacetum cinerariifolium]